MYGGGSGANAYVFAGNAPPDYNPTGGIQASEGMDAVIDSVANNYEAVGVAALDTALIVGAVVCARNWSPGVRWRWCLWV